MATFDRARIAKAAFLSTAIPATLLAASSYFAYTTAGFDFEAETATGAEVTYYRIRWDDGSTWIGRAVQPISRPHRPPDWFDPGGTILATPVWPAHGSIWNDLGFWRVIGPATDPYQAARYPGARSSVWLACPSWLPLLGLWLRPILRLVRRVGSDSRKA